LENSVENLETLRHSTAHLMAQAVQELYPGTKLSIGPAIEDGFYYDFDSSHAFQPEDLAKIEQKMREFSNKKLSVVRREMAKAEARAFWSQRGEKFKVELVEDIPDDKVSFYEQGSFIDLCRGPHVEHTGLLKHFKLLSVAGAYWRGDEHNPMLQRIYGTAFFSKEDLEAHLKRLEEAKLRDHRKLGKELGLFNIYDEAGAGLIFYLPKGAIIRRILEDFEKDEHLKRGYVMVTTPHLFHDKLFKISGHIENYGENMFFSKHDETDYVIKPMNCPGHILIYKSELRSYRDLPMRIFELGTVYRAERGGTLHGLLRVLGFTQDDSHLFCTWDNFEDELNGVVDFIRYVVKLFGFEFETVLSTRGDKKVIGSDEVWQNATATLKRVLERQGLDYHEEPGEAVFYGPKIDFKIKDVLGRVWQCATVQLDFNLPERFQLEYVAESGEKKRPVMIHRVLLGSVERFFGVLIEHYAGAFPTWLAPVQAKLIPITDKQLDYAQKTAKELQAQGLRVEIDTRNEKLGFKIRQAQLEKVPYMLIIGEKEQEAQKVAVRPRKGQDWGAVELEEFIGKIKEEITAKT